MKIIFTKHILVEKIPRLKLLGWNISKLQISKTIKKPQWVGQTRFGQPTAMSLVDERHILRVIFEIEDDIINVITIHIARRGKYESTK